jgi:hypothetical protein
LKRSTRDELIANLHRMASRLRQGIAEQPAAHGVKLRQIGPVQMPLILFDDDPQYEKGIAFCAAALQRGVYLHPRHNMFLCGAHGEKEIERALEATEGAFADLEPGAALLREVVVRFDKARRAVLEFLVVHRARRFHHLVKGRAVAIGGPDLEAILFVATECFCIGDQRFQTGGGH